MLSVIIIEFCHSMNLNSTVFEIHWHSMNSKSKFFCSLLDFVKKIRLYHNINIERGSWFRVYS